MGTAKSFTRVSIHALVMLEDSSLPLRTRYPPNLKAALRSAVPVGMFFAEFLGHLFLHLKGVVLRVMDFLPHDIVWFSAD